MISIREITLPSFYAWVNHDDISEKEQAIKIIEESAEVLGAVQNDREHIVYEIMDVIQACCNMLNLLGIDNDEIRKTCSQMVGQQIERGRIPRVITWGDE